MRVRTGLPVLVTVALLAGGCAAEKVDVPGPTTSPTSQASSSPTPTPTPDPVLEPSDPELGIVFEDVPELSDPDEIAVYNTVAVYQKEYWRMMTTNTVGIGFDIIASPDIKAMMQRIATQNADQQLTLGGVFHTRISTVVVDGQAATVTVCDDYRDVTAADPDGAYTSQEVGLRNLAAQLTLGPSVGGTWIALDSIPAGAC